ncbi:YkuS family protein [Schnuerera sp.]|uniref:YkuS family protein n=1 Tax=Schnuerera sp. TaxID=2794844 RepID=UPI002CC13A17|nr:YkuS family protein [Schnuerera sp.]HSH36848.1 YkuS family protein [Schnuerera sp.]
MKNKVVVENTLTPYIEHLKSLGYDVYTLYKNSNLENITSDEYKAIIVSGLDVLGTSGATHSKPPVPIIEASSHTPEEIHSIIESKYK